MTVHDPARRKLLQGSLALASALALPVTALAGKRQALTKTIPVSGEQIHPIGMGTWITFNVGRDKYLRNQRTKVLARFLAMGGQVVDSSPMYGSSEQVLGYALERINRTKGLFAASKTWTHSVQEGEIQFADSQKLWGRKQFALMQVHNLLAWKEQLAMLRELKQENLIRYIGVTTSHGRRHQALEKIMASEQLDFIQVTYNLHDRQVESRILPMAQDKGIAVIANRPLQGGKLFDVYARQKLPAWHKEAGCQSWADVFLRFVISHPAITCAIPATSQLSHMEENMASSVYPQLPDAQMRQRMLALVRG